MNDEKILATARSRFDAFLGERKLRRTPERYAILEHVFSTPEHFYIETLHRALDAHGYRVSLATIYNTVELLLQAGLIRRHQFDNQPAQYERVLQSSAASSHLHLVCTACGRVREMKDSRLTTNIHDKRFPAFYPSYFTLYVYGLCSKCMKKSRKS